MLFGIITLIIIFVIIFVINLDKPNPGLKRKKSSWWSKLDHDKFESIIFKVWVLIFYNLSIMGIIEKYNITNSLIKLLLYSSSMIVFFAIFPGRYFRQFKDFRRTIFFAISAIILTMFVYMFDK